MDQKLFDNVVGEALANGALVDPADVLPAFTDDELLAAVAERGLILAGEAGTIAVANTESAPSTIMPEIDPITSEKLEALPVAFVEQVVTRYAEKYVVVNGYIAEGKLPETYRLPALGELIDRVIAVAPAFEAIGAVKGTEVTFDFVPQYLSAIQKNELATGHKLPNGQTTTGLYSQYESCMVIDPTNPSPDESQWDVVVMDAAESSVIRGVSANGSNALYEVNLASTLKELVTLRNRIGLPTLPDKNKEGFSANELLVSQLSPSEDAIFGIQLSRLERGEQPLETTNDWMIGKENIQVDGSLDTSCAHFMLDDSGLYLDSVSRDIASRAGILRLSARGKDFIPQA